MSRSSYSHDAHTTRLLNLPGILSESAVERSSMSCNITNKDFESIGTSLEWADVAVEDLNLPLDELNALKTSRSSKTLKRTYLLHT